MALGTVPRRGACLIRCICRHMWEATVVKLGIFLRQCFCHRAIQDSLSLLFFSLYVRWAGRWVVLRAYFLFWAEGPFPVEYSGDHMWYMELNQLTICEASALTYILSCSETYILLSHFSLWWFLNLSREKSLVFIENRRTSCLCPSWMLMDFSWQRHGFHKTGSQVLPYRQEPAASPLGNLISSDRLPLGGWHWGLADKMVLSDHFVWKPIADKHTMYARRLKHLMSQT